MYVCMCVCICMYITKTPFLVSSANWSLEHEFSFISPGVNPFRLQAGEPLTHTHLAQHLSITPYRPCVRRMHQYPGSSANSPIPNASDPFVESRIRPKGGFGLTPKGGFRINPG